MQDDADDAARESPDEGFLGLREAAAQLGVHYMTAYRYVRIGTLPARKVKGSWQVRLSDLREVADREQPQPGRGGVRWPHYRTELRDCLIAGDEPASWSLVQRALASGADAEDVHLQLIAPVLAGIGDAWESGHIDVAAEHRASSVAARVIGRLGPSFARRGRKRGTVVIGATAGDRHSLPLAILGDVLRGRGLAVVDLGADTPPASFLGTARDRDDLIAIAIGVGSDDTIESARHTAALLHAELPGIPLFIGGPAIADAGRARALGADEYGATALDVAQRCLALSAGQPAETDRISDS